MVTWHKNGGQGGSWCRHQVGLGCIFSGILDSSKQVEASSVKNRQKSDVSVKLDVNEFVTYKCRHLLLCSARGHYVSGSVGPDSGMLGG